MLSKGKLTKELQRRVWWKTRKRYKESNIQLIIERYLRKHPEDIATYLANSELIYRRCKGAYEGKVEFYKAREEAKLRGELQDK